MTSFCPNLFSPGANCLTVVALSCQPLLSWS
jgi:hypothetical protein